MKFSNKVTIASIISSVLISSFVFFYNQSSFVKLNGNMLESEINEVTSSISNTISSEMDNGYLFTESLSRIIDGNEADSNSLNSVMSSQRVKANYLASGFGYEESGAFIENIEDWEPEKGFDPRDRPWYIKAKQSKSVQLTEPYIDVATGKIVITISSPSFSSSGDLIGVAFNDIDMSGLEKIIKSTKFNDSGELVLISESGNIIVSTDDKNFGRPISELHSGFDINNNRSVIQSNGKSELFEIFEVPGYKMQLVAIIDMNKLHQPLDKLQTKTFILSLLFLVVAILFLTTLIRYFLRPIEKISDEMINNPSDFTKRLSTDVDSEFRPLVESINMFIENSQNLLRKSKDLGDEVMVESHLVLSHSKASGDAVTQQVLELEQLATAMNEMSTTAQNISDNAQLASETSGRALKTTLVGTNNVLTTIDEISLLSLEVEKTTILVENFAHATDNIESIVKVISEIAEQTNLLALNAAIEAARAGENGRGFAVVADEVRTLATRTQSSTSVINESVAKLKSGVSSIVEAMSSSKQNANEVVLKANDAKEVLERINSLIEEINDVNMVIATSSEEQSHVSEEINMNTIRINQLSEDVSSQSVRTTESISKQIAKIKGQSKLIAEFEL